MNGKNSIVDTAGYTNMPVTVTADNVYVKVLDGRVYVLPNTVEGMIQFRNICSEQWLGVVPEQSTPAPVPKPQLKKESHGESET